MYNIFITSGMFAQEDETFGYLKEKGCKIVPNPNVFGVNSGAVAEWIEKIAFQRDI